MPVHLKDIHLEKGMHCVDCHFEQDNHGDGKLYGETRNAVMIDCVDCHGTIEKPAARFWLHERGRRQPIDLHRSQDSPGEDTQKFDRRISIWPMRSAEPASRKTRSE